MRSTGALVNELKAKGLGTKNWLSKNGKHHESQPFDRHNIYLLLNNPTYRGLCEYRGACYPGEHSAIIDQHTWDQVQAILAEKHREKDAGAKQPVPGFLKGLARCGHCGYAMTMSWVRGKNGVRHRYYKCLGSMKHGAASCPVAPIPAGELESAVLLHIRRFMRAPSIVQAISQKAQEDAARDGMEVDHLAVIQTLGNLDEVWGELFPAEQQRVAEALIESLIVKCGESTLTLRLDALQAIVRELGAEVDGRQVESVITLPIKVYKRCGRRKTIIAPSAEVPEPILAEATQDPIALALARAFRWRDEVELEHATLAEIAQREQVDSAYVRRHIRLTTLSPQLVEHLLNNGQENVVLSKLIKGEMAELWAEQRVC